MKLIYKLLSKYLKVGKCQKCGRLTKETGKFTDDFDEDGQTSSYYEDYCHSKAKKKSKQKLCEIARSFSYKLNVGNFESRDFFCSQKAEVPEKQAVKKSEELYVFCRAEVSKSVQKELKTILAAQKMAQGLKPLTPYEKMALKGQADQEQGESSRQENNK